jgi:FAD/FMN-containing dehydrogenase
MKRRDLIQTSMAAALAAALPRGAATAAALAPLGDIQGDLAAVTHSGTEVSLEAAAVKELRDSLRGNLLLPGNPGYDEARRVLNMSIDRNPALVIQPSGTADISHAINFAREREILLAVKCGGHSWSGKSTCEGGMQVDLSHFRHARVDPGARRAHVAGGSLLGELDHEAMAHGLVTTAGTVSHTGIGGLTLGGGFGRLARRFGLTLDNVVSVDIINADGHLRHASAEENPDLYWAVRGGGGNFGIVTRFELALHPMSREVIGGEVIYPISNARQVLDIYADYAMSAPEDLYLDFVMASPAGSKNGVAMMHACYSGPMDKADKVLAPLRKAGKPIADTLTKMDYVAAQRSGDDTDPRSTGEYVKSGYVSDIPEKLVAQLEEEFPRQEEFGTTVVFQHAGGAINRVAPDATAFSHRDANAVMLAFVSWPMEESGAEPTRILKEYWSSLTPFTNGWYSNEVSTESNRAISRNYQGNFDRLVEVKNQYDPTNLFRLNANIAPSV